MSYGFVMWATMYNVATYVYCIALPFMTHTIYAHRLFY